MMRRAGLFKNRLKAAGILAVLTALLLLVNLQGRTNVTDMNQTLTSLRNDRLLPVVYAQEITRLLYENKMLISGGYHSAEIKANFNAIEVLAKKYEATKLTAEETTQWKQFRLELKQLSITEQTVSTSEQMTSFNHLQKALARLTDIQVIESARLMKNGEKAISSNILLSNLMAGLGLASGILILVLLNITRYSFHQPEQRHMLN